METWLLAGLGNPEKKYEGSRHNAGFAAADALAKSLCTGRFEKKFKGLITRADVGEQRIYLVKPLTYMNLSGECVATAAGYYRIPADHVIVLVDDVNLAVGRLRVRGSGSAGGHNGLKSIIRELGTDAFPRVRIGVGGAGDGRDLVSHVLGHLEKKDLATMEKAYEEAGRAALCIAEHGVAEAMNRFNGLDLAPQETAEHTD